MYGLDIALNPIDGLGADIAKGIAARCILLGACGVLHTCVPRMHRDGGWTGQGVERGRVSFLAILSDEP